MKVKLLNNIRISKKICFMGQFFVNIALFVLILINFKTGDFKQSQK